MKRLLERAGRLVAVREGFALPAIVFALAFMSIVAVVLVRTSADEMRSGQALRHSTGSFYAAEAGLKSVLTAWPESLVDTLQAGSSVDLGSGSLPGGGSYNARVQRVDDGSGQKLYLLTSEGRDASGLGGQRAVSLMLTKSPAAWSHQAGVNGRGSVDVGSGAQVDGTNTEPPGWSGLCDEDTINSPGLRWDDTTSISDDGGTISGDPPKYEDTGMDNDDIYSSFFGGLTWDDLVAMATYTITDEFVGAPKTDGSGACVMPYVGSGWVPPFFFYPTGVHNMGSPDPLNDCFDQFPIVHIQGAWVDYKAGFGQGIWLVEGRLDISAAAVFYGIMIVKGCLDHSGGAKIYGTILIDGNVDPNCGTVDLNQGGDAETYWSSCAVDRSMELNSLAGGSSIRPLISRAFTEVLR